MNKIIVLLPLLLMLAGQSHAQWQKLNMPSAAKVNALAILDSNIIAGTDGDGILCSSDDGESWVSMNEGLQNKVVRTIFVVGSTMFAGTETGASRSTDKGLTWNSINTGLSDNGVWSFAAMNINPRDTAIFAGTWSGVYSSTNDGDNWKATGLSSTTMPVHSLITRGPRLFAATVGNGVFSSEDNGFTWDDISIISTDEWFGTKYLNAVYSLAIIDTTVIASVDRGQLFYYAALAESPFVYIQATSSTILCFAHHKGQLFAGTAIGDIFSSNFDGSVWKVLSSSVKGHAIYSLSLNESFMLAGTESGIWRLQYPVTSTVTDYEKEVPAGFALAQNYPNPFNSSTIITFTIPSSSRVSLKVYNILGVVVGNLVDGPLTPGTYKVEFSPAGLASGILFYSLIANEFRITKKLMLLK